MSKHSSYTELVQTLTDICLWESKKKRWWCSDVCRLSCRRNLFFW